MALLYDVDAARMPSLSAGQGPHEASLTCFATKGPVSPNDALAPLPLLSLLLLWVFEEEEEEEEEDEGEEERDLRLEGDDDDDDDEEEEEVVLLVDEVGNDAGASRMALAWSCSGTSHMQGSCTQALMRASGREESAMPLGATGAGSRTGLADAVGEVVIRPRVHCVSTQLRRLRAREKRRGR